MSNDKERLLIAHRGERLLAPENTIKGCELALAQGATALEVDIQICGSGEPVLMHDVSLRRCFGRGGKVTHLPRQELQTLTFSNRLYRYNDRLCTLEAFLETFRGRVPINLDLKSYRRRNDRYVEQLTKLMRRMNLGRQVWFSSFNPLLLRQLKEAEPTARTGYLFQNPSFVHAYIDTFLNSDAWHPHFKNFNDRLYEKARRMKKEIYVWTVNRDDVLARLNGYEIDGIITDTFFRKNGRWKAG